MNETKQEEAPSGRDVKLFQGVLYGIGCGIGGSIFILLGDAIRIAGPGVLISLLLGGILIFFTALNYAELSTSLPIAGGAYNFSKEGLGGFLAFIIGFFLWIANIATCSFSAQIFALLFDEVFKKFGITAISPFTAPIAIIAIVFTSVVIFRAQSIAIKALIYLTVSLIGILGFFVICGLIISPIINPPMYNPEFLFSGTDFFSVISIFSLLFIFYTSITSNLAYLSVNLKNPSKTIPRIYMLAIVLTLAIYISVTLVVLINIGNDASSLDDSPILLANILMSILGPFGIVGFFIMALAILISTLIAINASLGSATSIITALARDRYLPAKIKEKKKVSNFPPLALIITALIVSVFTYFAEIGLTAETVSFIYFFGLATVNYAAVKLRRKRKSLDRPFKAPFFPFLPILISLLFLFFSLFLSFTAILLGFLISIIGVAYYLITIADRHSIRLTLAGIKFLLIIILGVFIWFVNNFSATNPSIILINRVLIIICIFNIGLLFFDIISLREIVYYFVKKIDKQVVAIHLGKAQIIELGKKKSRILIFVNFILLSIELISIIVTFFILFLVLNGIVGLQEISFGSTVIIEEAALFIFISLLTFLELTLVFSSILMWLNYNESKSF
ncbi:MAG: amino acid permease [Promethearchaeota archaeon]|nr:MAG: amino acid permease [Candidatus Lokiarchaeota archaeon]